MQSNSSLLKIKRKTTATGRIFGIFFGIFGFPVKQQSLTLFRHSSQRILGHCCRQPGRCGKFNRNGGRKEKEERGKERKGSVENERLHRFAKHAGPGWSCGAQSQINLTVKRVRADIFCARSGQDSLDAIQAILDIFCGHYQSRETSETVRLSN